MAVSYRVDGERGLLTVVLEGVVTETDFDELTEKVGRDPRRDPHWPALVDASELVPAGITTELLRMRASIPRPNAVRIAVVAPTNVVFGLARMFQMMSEGHGNHIEVFRSTPEAMAWLEGASDVLA